MVSQTLWNIEEKMRNSVDVLKRELDTIRTGHATPALIEHIKAEYAGVPTPLNQLAGISAHGTNLLVIQPWDPSSISGIEKAILKSDLGLTPTNDGSVIRLNIPPLTEERRQELIKVVRKKVEEERIAIRNLRREAMNELKGLEKLFEKGRPFDVELEHLMEGIFQTYNFELWKLPIVENVDNFIDERNYHSIHFFTEHDKLRIEMKGTGIPQEKFEKLPKIAFTTKIDEILREKKEGLGYFGWGLKATLAVADKIDFLLDIFDICYYISVSYTHLTLPTN